LVSSAFGYYFYTQKSGKSESIKSIAILPLISLSNDESERALAAGIKEKLLMNLGRLSEINIQNVNLDESEIDKITKADSILLGNVQKADGKIRVNLRFLRASDKKQLWSESFDENQTDLFKLQDAISDKVTDSLALNLTQPEKNTIFRRYTENADAYELYLKGRYYWNKRNFGFSEEAETYFRKAIEKDPKFALAYVGLADKLLINGEKDADFYLTKALEIEPNLAEAYASRGFWNTFNRWDWERAESDFKKSIELNPGYGRAYQWYATLLMIRGRQPEAIAKLQRAIEIEPQSFNFYSDLGQAYYFASDYENAEKYCQKALEINPEFGFAHEHLAEIYLERGELERSMTQSTMGHFYSHAPQDQTAEMKKYLEHRSSEAIKFYRQNGLNAHWQKQLENYKLQKKEPQSFYNWAYVLTKAGEKEKAIDSLEKAVERREFLTPFINVELYFDELRSEPRFQAIIKKMNL
jgi:tetratricopeptide (TPR) repeat protein